MKSNPVRIKKTRSELVSDLEDQIELLVGDCELFDAGQVIRAKPIAVTLSLLLYGTENKKPSLLQQLQLRSGYYPDTATPDYPESSFPVCRLAALFADVDDGKARYIPVYSTTLASTGKTGFSDWWSVIPVIRDFKRRTFTRMQLVKEMRDTEAGHADPALQEHYADLRAGRYMGWRMRVAGEVVHVQRPHLACIRQIAHEVLLHLSHVAPAHFRKEYRAPTSLPTTGIVVGDLKGQIRPVDGKLPPPFEFNVDGKVTLIADMDPAAG